MASFIKELFFNSSKTEQEFRNLSQTYMEQCPTDLSKRPEYKVTFMGVFNDRSTGPKTFSGGGVRARNDFKQKIDAFVDEIKVNGINIGYIGIQHGNKVFQSMGEVSNKDSPFYAIQGKVGIQASGARSDNAANIILSNGIDIIKIVGGEYQNAVYKVELITSHCDNLKNDIKKIIVDLHKEGFINLEEFTSDTTTEDTIDQINAKLLNRRQQQVYTDNRATFLKLTFFMLCIINFILVCVLIYFLSK